MQDLTLLNTKSEAIIQDIQVFNCELGSIRVIVENGEPFFMASDLCQVLEYKNGRDTINRLFPKGVAKYYTPTNGGNQLFSYLTEPQMYKLIMRSNAKNAEAFQDWICNEVLPTIRKTGAYSIQQQIPKTYGEALLEAGRLALENERLLTQAKENQPKIEAFNELMSSNDSLDFLTFSKVIKMGRNTLFKKLRELQILRQDNTPYQKYVDRGYFKVVETTYRYSENQKVGINYKTIIYPKGQTFIINLLKNPTKGE
ncbi:phage antirepressor KilAC domain-containing protein [Campylobacter lanienae]|uniref:phage antirepressor KilAC domain-containing protein n=1 Tax=Campylobacter lanienae TaxID=75658 RepID=UPI002A918BCE|nr:phage antirepressor KilAC domain-containing protein [Campylobacter lanienae]MDY5519678.1 phage antirepressor KilAC domain-containing protein [Campylobacter lanienae]